MTTNDHLVIMGAGPAGLTAAHEAVGAGARVTVVECSPSVGGLARTIPFEGNRFDIGPHRFFTKNAEISALFEKILGEDAVSVSRLTRILHGGTFFDYPITAVNAMFGLGPATSLAVGASYAKARLSVAMGAGGGDSFEDWIVDHFGRRLFDLFFRSYTEKVWGIRCRDISSEWAAQRIKGLSLGRAVMHALRGSRGDTIKTMIDEFRFPRLGAGQTWEKLAAAVSKAGGTIMLRSPATALCHANGRVTAMTVARDGVQEQIAGDGFLVSAPLTDVVAMMDPPAPESVLAAARSLRYRNHICVNLVVRGNPFPDNWIYVHDDSVGMARIANYRNFSADMAASPAVSPITAEYFSFPGDAFDTASDERMIELATAELAKIGLARPETVLSGFVVRNVKAYPVIERGHDGHVATIRNWLRSFDNLLPIGRSGMFKYNNQDHAMMTGMLAARTMLRLGTFDPWAVNIDAEYHEEGPARPS